MAKEKMIVFVFDTSKSCESEDLAEAVLYFHPVWVSEHQRHALCGQIIGTAHCAEALLGRPNIISLMSGKFALQQYSNYTLAIGSDRDIPDWVLKSRVELLTSLIKTYHGDLSNVASTCDSTKQFSEKLFSMFETYLPILQYGCHIFQRVPLLTLPKSASSVFLESQQVLEHCQKYKGVLGGVVLYNNKIISSQLPPALTSHLVVVDPYRVKSPAEPIKYELLPEGTQLLVVHVTKSDYRKMKKVAERMQKQRELIAEFKEKTETENEKPPQFPTTGMKRDKSLLFTAVIEEDHTTNESNDTQKPEVIPFANKARQRPSKLALATRNISLEEEDYKENKETGQTSICSTPMVEYKQLFGNVISICQNSEPSNAIVKPKLSDEEDVESLQFRNKVENYMSDCKITLDLNNIADHYIDKPVMKKPASFSDIQGTIKRMFRLKKTKSSSEDLANECHLKTINDPSFPVFRNDGTAVSQSLYQYYFRPDNASIEKADSFENFDSDMKMSPKKSPLKKVETKSAPTSFSNQECLQTKESPPTSFKSNPETELKHDSMPNKIETKDRSDVQAKRKSLTLPLKELSNNDQAVESKLTYDGIPMTPLIEQLNSLATDWSGYMNKINPVMTPMVEKSIIESSLKDGDADNDGELDQFSKSSVKLAMFVSGLQNMSMITLLERDAATNTRLIYNLWLMSLNSLGSIGQKCMEVQQQTSSLESNSEYSHLVLDPDWGGVKKGGVWASSDIALMAMLHNEFAEDSTLEEFVFRTDESVVLGSQCGGAEVYYQENSPKQPGPPGPSDAMATAIHRAKRLLHSDHSYVIL